LILPLKKGKGKGESQRKREAGSSIQLCNSHWIYRLLKLTTKRISRHVTHKKETHKAESQQIFREK
jgi:hypothetical protein